jgi:hypothetical protein
MPLVLLMQQTTLTPQQKHMPINNVSRFNSSYACKQKHLNGEATESADGIIT